MAVFRDSKSEYTGFSKVGTPSSHKVDSISRRKSRGRRIKFRPSQWVNKAIKVKDGNKGRVASISFEERPYLQKIYDSPAQRILLMTSRQTEKSTTIGNKILADAQMRPMHAGLFVCPSAMQTQVFSRTRIDDIITISPLVKAMTSKHLTMNLLEKHFINGAKVYLRYAYLSADRSRGLSVNSLYCDEVQDLLKEVMPILEETTSHFDHPRFVYSGTPKTFNNTIEKYWSEHSTQNEWVIPCERHGTPKDPGSWHWNILGPKNLGKTGPICDKCGGPLNPEHPHAQWARMNTTPVDGHEPPVEGFRVCRLMVPWFWKNPKRWQEMLEVMQLYPVASFMNEVLALSYDEGIKPLSEHHITAVSDPKVMMTEEEVDVACHNARLYGGVDWGVGESGKSYTVLTVGGYTRGDGRFQVLFSKRFTGESSDPDKQVDEIIAYVIRWNLKYLGSDYGMGLVQNKRLTNKFGPDRIRVYQYLGKAPGKINFSPKRMVYILFRTLIMADIFNAIRGGKIMFPNYEVYKKPYAEDMLSIVSEYSDTLRMIKYDKINGGTDDTFHSLVYTMMASFIDHPRPDIVLPLKMMSGPENHSANHLELEMADQVENYV